MESSGTFFTCPPVVRELALHYPRSIIFGEVPISAICPDTMLSRSAETRTKVNPDDDYVTPGDFELERLFWKGSVKFAHVNEVWPNIYIGDEVAALDRYAVEKMGFTHILNAAHGRGNVDTGEDYYRNMPVDYYGVEAEDLTTFDLSKFFYPAAQYIERALRKPSSKVLVHCARGRSRSASLVLAYLMIYKDMTVVDAAQQVLKHRCILPNRGFLKQLRALDVELVMERSIMKNGASTNGNGKES